MSLFYSGFDIVKFRILKPERDIYKGGEILTARHMRPPTGMPRRFVALLFAVVVAFTAFCARAEYPERAVHLVVGVDPGGGTDALARLVAGKLSAKWGQPVIVENRPSNFAVVATEYLKNAAPDGYTLMANGSDHTIAPGSLPKLSYDPIKDFTPITLLAIVPNVLLVNPSYTQAKTLKELIDTIKAQPGKFNFGSAGGAPLLQMELLMKRTGMQMVKIEYKGVGPTMIALLGGEIQLAFYGAAGAVLEQVKSGKLRALAVSTAIRAPLLPDVPTVAEAADLPGYDISQWYGMIAPAGVPKPIIDKVNRDVVDVLKASDVRDTLTKQGFIPAAGPSAEFADRIAKEIPEFTALLKSGQ